MYIERWNAAIETGIITGKKVGRTIMFTADLRCPSCQYTNRGVRTTKVIPIDTSRLEAAIEEGSRDLGRPQECKSCRSSSPIPDPGSGGMERFRVEARRKITKEWVEAN